MENQTQAPIQSLGQANLNPPSLPKTNATFVAVFCFLVGIPLILVALVFLLFVIPQIENLYRTLAPGQASGLYFSYPVVFLTIFIGILNIFFGIKTLKDNKFTKRAAIIATFSFGGQALLIILFALTIIMPIYSLISNIGVSR